MREFRFVVSGRVFRVLGFLMAGSVVGLVLWYSLRGFTTKVEFSKEDIQQRVERYVDENGQFGDTVVFNNPKVLLEEEGNRVGLKVDLKVSAYGRTGTGSLTSTGKLAYRPENGTFYLSELRIADITLDGVPQFAMKMVTDYVQGTLDKMTPNIPVYTFKESSLKERAAKLVLQTVEVKPGKVVATVGY